MGEIWTDAEVAIHLGLCFCYKMDAHSLVAYKHCWDPGHEMCLCGHLLRVWNRYLS